MTTRPELPEDITKFILEMHWRAQVTEGRAAGAIEFYLEVSP